MVRIGILGAGRVVQNRYVEVFRDELKDTVVTMVCDKVRARAEEVAAQLGAQAVVEKKMLLENDGVDAILIATESGKHYLHAREALKAGKHVIVEKPPALIPSEVLENERLAQKRGLMYAVVFQNRLNPAMGILKEVPCWLHICTLFACLLYPKSCPL